MGLPIQKIIEHIT